MTEFVTRVITGLILGSIFWISFIFLPPIYFSCLLVGILFIIMLFEWSRFFPLRRITFWLLWPFYPVLPFVLLIYLNQHPLYHNLLLELFLLVASFDTGSYVVGRLVGRHAMVPTISPGKTWEGAVGGYIFAVIGLAFLVLYEQGKMISWWIILGFTLIVCLLAFLGDLFESLLKRRAHIKHSGTMLPGHGGFLDRFDGILFVVFFFFLFRAQLAVLFG
jgi:phosphatidate cytidylyltransferase